MNALRVLLVLSTVMIYVATVIAAMTEGINWPSVAVADLLSLNWRSQFNADFIVHLLLLATWIAWREGCGAKGWFFGLISIVMGGLFSFPYLVYAVHKSGGDAEALMLGKRLHASL